MKIDIQRIRNLTTYILHTKMGDIYEDLEWFTGEKGIMTHQLPNICKAVTPYLAEHIKDSRFWEKKYDTEHIGTIDIPEPSEKDRELMIKRYKEMPSFFESW
jgi:hypothetical protein